MPKIVFIEPRAPNLHIFSQFPLPRPGTWISVDYREDVSLEP